MLFSGLAFCGWRRPAVSGSMKCATCCTVSVPASRRRDGGEELARRKQQELDEQIARLKAMRRVVDRVLQCRCVELPECGRIAASVMETRSMKSLLWYWLAAVRRDCRLLRVLGVAASRQEARSGRLRAFSRS